MVRGLIASAACVALMSAAGPALAQAPLGAAASLRMFDMPTDPGVNAFYASRNGQPLWLADGPNSSAARTLVTILKRASLEGFADGPAIASQAEAWLARASTDDSAALIEADRQLSAGWVRYVQMLRQTPTEMTYAEQWIAPRKQTASEILKLAAASRSLDAHLRSVAAVNPFYASLRDAAWQQVQAGGFPDSRIVANLERLRPLPAKGRYVVVDAASAQLWMVEDGRIADTMKVIVGKPSSQTPMVASVIHYATLNPYWNVPPDLAQRIIARNVLDQGHGYLKARGYQVLSGPGEDAEVIDPSEVDWKAVAEARATVRVRQLPGPGNSMGDVKFAFANSSDVYLHDTPNKDLFAQAERDVSNGCIRLEDAERFGRWLAGGQLQASSGVPEQHVLLPRPVPIYVTYLTARADGGQLTWTDDPYGRDTRRMSEMAALR